MSLALARLVLAAFTTAAAVRRPSLRAPALALSLLAALDAAGGEGRVGAAAWAAWPVAAVWLASKGERPDVSVRPLSTAGYTRCVHPKCHARRLWPSTFLLAPLAVAIAPRGFWPAHPDAYAAVMWLPHLIAPSVIAWALLLKDEGPAGFGLPVRPVSPGSLRAKSARLVGPGDPFLGHHEARLPPAQAVAAIFAASGTADIVAGAGQAGVSAVARALGMPLPDGAPWSLAAPMSWATLAAVALVVARATRRV